MFLLTAFLVLLRLEISDATVRVAPSAFPLPGISYNVHTDSADLDTSSCTVKVPVARSTQREFDLTEIWSVRTLIVVNVPKLHTL